MLRELVDAARELRAVSPALAPRQPVIKGQRPVSPGNNLSELLAREANIHCGGITIYTLVLVTRESSVFHMSPYLHGLKTRIRFLLDEEML